MKTQYHGVPTLLAAFIISCLANCVLMILYFDMKRERDDAIQDHIHTIEKQKAWIDSMSSK